MVLQFTWQDTTYQFDSSSPISIGIPLRRGLDNQPNAYSAPPFDVSPVVSGSFTGSLEAGSPVNFFNVSVNPHGNGTHTECVGHILPGKLYLDKGLKPSLFVAQLITVIPSLTESGDRVIGKAALEGSLVPGVDAIVMRTHPNTKDKLTRKYSGTNPPYLSEEAMRLIVRHGARHLLVDLPSVDREEDEGLLTNHNIFWETSKKPRLDKTITELIFVDNTVSDALYLLDIHELRIELDASPSSPVLYSLTHVK